MGSGSPSILSFHSARVALYLVTPTFIELVLCVICLESLAAIFGPSVKREVVASEFENSYRESYQKSFHFALIRIYLSTSS